MPIRYLLVVPLLAVATLGTQTPLRPADPVALTLLPDGKAALVVLRARGTLARVALDNSPPREEISCGQRPEHLAVTGDGKRAVVVSPWDHTLTWIEVGFTLREQARTHAGARPGGAVFDRSGSSLFVALEAEDAVAVVASDTRREVRRWPVPPGPRLLSLSPDGKQLAVACEAEGCVVFLDTATGRMTLRRTLVAAYHLRGLTYTSDGATVYLTHLANRGLPVRKSGIEEGWVVGTRLTRIATRRNVVPAVEQIALDPRGDALADPEGLSLDPSGARLLLGVGGTHEVVALDLSRVPWTDEQPGDHLSDTARERNLLQRWQVGGRPTGLVFLDSTRALVANALLDSLQIVNVERRQIERTISLGGPGLTEPVRAGEAIFHDATRSHHHWLSCHTCHTDGHTSGQRFDTLTDGHHGNPKLTLSLRGVAQTGPWNWHGAQGDLDDAIRTSFTQTMSGPEPSDAEVRNLRAYLQTLDHPPGPYPGRGAEVAAGRALFEGKAGCVRCHAGPDFTTRGTYKVFPGIDTEPNPLFNPPSLRSVWSRRPLLHDGRAVSLEEVLDDHHPPHRTGGAKPSNEERLALLAYLRSL